MQGQKHNSKCCIPLDLGFWMLRVHNWLWHQKCPFLNVQMWSVRQRSLNNSQFAIQDGCYLYQHWRRTVQFIHQLLGPFCVSEKSVLVFSQPDTLANNTEASNGCESFIPFHTWNAINPIMKSFLLANCDFVTCLFTCMSVVFGGC